MKGMTSQADIMENKMLLEKLNGLTPEQLSKLKLLIIAKQFSSREKSRSSGKMSAIKA